MQRQATASNAISLVKLVPGLLLLFVLLAEPVQTSIRVSVFAQQDHTTTKPTASPVPTLATPASDSTPTTVFPAKPTLQSNLTTPADVHQAFTWTRTATANNVTCLVVPAMVFSQQTASPVDPTLLL